MSDVSTPGSLSKVFSIYISICEYSLASLSSQVAAVSSQPSKYDLFQSPGFMPVWKTTPFTPRLAAISMELFISTLLRFLIISSVEVMAISKNTPCIVSLLMSLSNDL